MPNLAVMFYINIEIKRLIFMYVLVSSHTVRVVILITNIQSLDGKFAALLEILDVFSLPFYFMYKCTMNFKLVNFEFLL